MHPGLIQVMRDQVYTIYRAATGTDLPESEPSPSEAETPLEEVTRSFAELEAMARTIPLVSERVPPFSFTPPLDALIEGDDLVIEVAIPGIERKDVTVECKDEMLIVSGIRRHQCGAREPTYSHGEIPCGPFYRSFHVPFPIRDEPAVELDRGMLRVRLSSLPAIPQPEDQKHPTSQEQSPQEGRSEDQAENQTPGKQAEHIN